MPWINGHIRANHPREEWNNSDPKKVIVHSFWDDLKGTRCKIAGGNEARKEAYRKAKTEFDLNEAMFLVRSLVEKKSLDKLVDKVIETDVNNCTLVMPFPAFEEEAGNGAIVSSGPTNALPFAYSAFLSEFLGCRVDTEITLKARIGRSKLGRWPRFLFQPSFGGDVDRDTNYIIVDDVVTSGGTFAALRSYIVSQGGRVCAATALAHNLGKDVQFPVTARTLKAIEAAFGQSFDGFWKGAVGHGLWCLTEAEACFLLDWIRQNGSGKRDENIQRVRNRLNKAASKGE